MATKSVSDEEVGGLTVRRHIATAAFAALVVVSGAAGVVVGQSDQVCLDIATSNGDSENWPTHVFVVGQNNDFYQHNMTTDASSPDACDLEEDLDSNIMMGVPSGEYTITVRNEESAVHERWGAYDVTVEDVEEESFWLIRKAPYHTSVDVESPRGSDRFEPGETAEFEARVYNTERSDTRDVTTEVYVYPEGSDRPDQPTETLSTVSISSGRHATVDGSVTMPDAEGEYVVDVEFVTNFGTIERPSDYVDLGTVTVDSFEAPSIDDSTPTQGAVDLGPEEQRTFAVSVSDPDSTPTVRWYVDGSRSGEGEQFEFDASQFGAGEHTVRVVASDGTDATENADIQWTVDVADAPEIRDVSPESTVIGKPVSFSVDTESTGHRYRWIIGTRTFSGNGVEKTFSSPGDRAAKVTVTNDRGITAERSFVFSVERAPPSINGLSVSSSSVTVGEPVELLTSASDPADRDTGFDYEWQIDGRTVSGSSVETTFSEAGSYDVELTVTNDYGTTTTRTRTVTVEAAPPSITELDVSPSAVSLGESVTLSADALDPVGRDTGFDYDWTVGDRTFEGASVETSLSEAGTYDVVLTVTNDYGETATRTATLTVEAEPPSITSYSVSPTTLTAGEQLSLSATATDPVERGTAFSYEWSVADESLSGATAETRIAEVGTHDVELTVTNDYGTTTTRTRSVTVRNDEPVVERLSPDRRPTARSGTESRFLVRVADADAAEATVTWTVDGQQVTSRSVSADERRVAFTRRFTDPGTHTVEATVEDGHGARATLDWTVDVTNRPPRIERVEPSSASFGRMSGTTETFIANATDPDGGPVSHRWLVDGSQQGTGPRYTHTFDDAETHNVTVIATDSDGGVATHSWSASVRNFRRVPEIDSSVTLTRLRADDQAEFIGLSFRNPSVNNRTAHVELALSLPSGVTVSATRNSRGGSQPEYVGEATVAPGQQTSISLAITVEDESLAGQQIDVPYQVIYYPDGQRDSYHVVENATTTLRIAETETATTERTTGDSASGSSATDTGTAGSTRSTTGTATGTEPTIGVGPGFTGVGVLLALCLWVGIRRQQN